jgi:hypothetical protein
MRRLIPLTALAVAALALPPGFSRASARKTDSRSVAMANLTVRGGENDAAQLTALTQGAMIKSNVKVKGEIITAVVKSTPFKGPGAVYTLSLEAPATARPGTVYDLDLTDAVMNDEQGNALPVKAASGQLVIVAKNKKLPANEKPSLSGSTLAVGRIYAHSGSSVKVDVFVGDGAKSVAGLQAKLKFQPKKSRKIAR